MKIVDLKTFKAYFKWRNWLFVKLYTDEGITGVGEATMHGNVRAVEAAIHERKGYLIGRDPMMIERHWQALYRNRRWRGGPVLNSALSGIEQALWDIQGKALDVPVYQLLGGPYRDRVKCYANAWFRGTSSIEERVERALWVVEELGYEAMKWEPLGEGNLTERESVAHAVKEVGAIREAVGEDVDLLIECSERFSPRTAILAAKALEPFKVYFLEEPVGHENIAAMAWVNRESPVPIATGERLYNKYQFRELLEAQACDIIQPDLTHVGGIMECKKVAALAEAWYVSVCPHNSGGPVSHAASLALAGCIPNFGILEAFVDEAQFREECTIPPLKIVDGYYDLPKGPGLGVDINEEALAKYPYRELTEWDDPPFSPIYAL